MLQTFVFHKLFFLGRPLLPKKGKDTSAKDTRGKSAARERARAKAKCKAKVVKPEPAPKEKAGKQPPSRKRPAPK